ncbi:MAG: YchJ family protein [Rubrivivax sp.]
MPPALPPSEAPCPCTSGRRFGDCCRPWLTGADAAPAPTAEALMRSRYCAWALGLRDYLLATWHPSTRPTDFGELDSRRRWLGLEVRSHRVTGPNTAEVEFVARSKEAGGRATRHDELSRFRLETGRWTYVDGDIR